MIFLAIIFLLSFIFGYGLLVWVLISALLAWLLCPIEPCTHYTWYSGLWHGFWFVENLILYLLPTKEVIMKAADCTTGYNICYYPMAIVSVLTSLGGLGRGRR